MIITAVPPTQSVVWPFSQRAMSGGGGGCLRFTPPGGLSSVSTMVMAVAIARATARMRRRQGMRGNSGIRASGWSLLTAADYLMAVGAAQAHHRARFAIEFLQR